MEKQRTGLTPKFLTTAASWSGIWILVAMVAWGAGCSRTPSEYSQFPPNAEGLFLAGLRPPAGDTTLLLRNAHYLKLMGRPELAFKELEAAYQQDPRNIKVLNALALACDEMGEFNQAQKLYQEALALDVSNQALNNNLCFSYYLAGQWDKAEACFRQAVARNPRNIMARNNLGLLLCRRGRTEEASRLWQEAEGGIAAQKKMQQVMVALGSGETSHFAQLPESAPVASAPIPEPSTPSPGVAQDASPAKVAWPSNPATPQPQVPATPPVKVREALKLAANPAPAEVPPHQEASTLLTAATPGPPPVKEPAAPVQAQRQPASPKPLAKPAPAVTQKKPAPPIPATAPAKSQTLPAPPQRTADTDKKPAPAATPQPPSQPGKVRLSAAPAPAGSTPGKPAQSGIEVANACGGFNLARQTRAMLKGEGFKVVTISNNHGQGSADTVIYYRPAAEKEARAINARFFPKSRLELGDKFAGKTDIKVVLGKDQLASLPLADKAVLTAEKIAAGPGSSQKKSPPAAAVAAPAPVAARPQQKPAPDTVPAAAAAPVQVAAQEAQPKSYLTTAELEAMGIDIRNGTPAHDLARKTRAMLSQEGFNVVHIGNHIDFGAEKTIIFYRPGAEKMAQNLNHRFFSNSSMEQTAKLPEDVAVKVLLGKDLLQRTEVMAKLDD